MCVWCNPCVFGGELAGGATERYLAAQQTARELQAGAFVYVYISSRLLHSMSSVTQMHCDILFYEDMLQNIFTNK